MSMKDYLNSCLEKVIAEKAQDLFLKVGALPHMRVGGQVLPIEDLRELTEAEMMVLAQELLGPKQMALLDLNRSVDFAFSYVANNCRFRANAFFQQGHISLVLRLLWKGVPDFDQLNLPPILRQVALEKSGIILIGGVVSSGKTTTLAAMINAMNKNVYRHILTVEDPVEYAHDDEKCLIQQREIGHDAHDFMSALKYVVRQSPDVIVIGEMRDAETFSFALSAAEVGRLVLATIHAQSVPQIFDRVLGFFKPEHRDNILRHFASNVTCLMVQKLLVGKEKGLIPAAEILLGTYTIKQLILEKKFDKLPQAIRNGVQEGMQTMDQSLLALWEKKMISEEVALAASQWPHELQTQMKGIHIGHEGKILGA